MWVCIVTLLYHMTSLFSNFPYYMQLDSISCGIVTVTQEFLFSFSSWVPFLDQRVLFPQLNMEAGLTNDALHQCAHAHVHAHPSTRKQMCVHVCGQQDALSSVYFYPYMCMFFMTKLTNALRQYTHSPLRHFIVSLLFFMVPCLLLVWVSMGIIGPVHELFLDGVH